MAILGAVVGSFLNVVVYRLPAGESVVKPRSRCGACGTTIRPWHNVPIVSWLALRGRCSDCHAKISVRYPLVEAATAVLYGLVVWYEGFDRDAVLPLLLVTALVPVFLIDLEHRIIPNQITGLAAVAAVVAALALDPSSVPERLAWGAGAGVLFLLIALAAPGGMGMGDVKLVGVLGLYLKASVAPAVFAALILGTVVGIGVMQRKGMRAGRKTTVPFGPFLVAGALIAIFFGPHLIDAYRNAF